MSKSLNNFVFIKDLKNQFSSSVVRMFLLSNNYVKNLNFTHERLLQIA